MKLRIRFQARRKVIEVGSSLYSLTEVKKIIQSHFLLTNVNFKLSLDGKTPLPTEESSSLADLGIVGGDLLFIMLDDDRNIPEISQQSVQRALQQIKNPSLNEALDVINKEESSTSINMASSSSNFDTKTNKSMDTISASSKEHFKEEDYCNKNTQRKTSNNEDSHNDGPSQKSDELLKLRKVEYTPKALLCRDGTPYSLQISYKLANINTMHEAICVAVHVLMLETGFLNHDTEERKTKKEEPSTSSQSDPEPPPTSSIISNSWRTESGAKFLYTHPACPALISSVLCTSLGPYVLVHGMSNSPSCTEVHHCRLPAADFVKGNIDLKSNSAADVYKNLQRLSLAVKDQIAYPLLSSMRHELNLEEIYGFMALPTEVKLIILCLLPVEDILNMSTTCREMHTITCDHVLWQHLCFRDFGLLNKGRYSSWKMEYQRHYKDLQERERNRHYFMPEPSFMPDHSAGMYGVPNVPNHFPGIIGGRHDLFPSVPFMPGGLHPNPGSIPTPGNLPHPHFDPYGPVPDMDINPGPNRRTRGRGRGRGGFPPGPFF